MPRKSGIYPVKLRITHDGKQRYYTIRYEPVKPGTGFTEYQNHWIKRADKSIAMTEKEFGLIFDNKKGQKEPYQTMCLYLNTLLNDAKEVIAETGQGFNFETFEERFFAAPTDKNDLFSLMLTKAKEKRALAKISTAVVYECAVQSLKTFTGKEKFPMAKLTVKFLKDYEKFMIDSGNSKTTCGMYLRNVRATFNAEKPAGVVYPFGRAKNGFYQIPKGKNIKKALTLAEVSKIANYKPEEGSFEHWGRDLWLFSYLCNGINIKDVLRLRYQNIKDDKIILERAKTSDSVDSDTKIEIIITRQIGRIIDRWGQKPGLPETFIFGILKKDFTPEQEYRAIQQAVQTINKNMKKVCEKLEMSPVTSYGARHSFATALKRSGASVEFIAESLGHKNQQTTMNYLGSFEDDQKRQFAIKIAQFDKPEE